MVKIKSPLIAIAAAGLFLTVSDSCNNPSADQSGNKTDSTKTEAKKVDSVADHNKKEIEFKFFTVEDNLPAPFAIVNDIYTYNLPFNAALVNQASNVTKYTSSFKKEVNYGIYGLDMAYISFYNHNQDELNLFSSAKTLADQLNVTKVFDQFNDRFKSNASNKDSLIRILDNVYKETDDYLKKNDRFPAASHILAGALIELNYLSLNLVKDVKQTPENAKLFEKIYNENLYIYHLTKLFEEFKDKESMDLLADMKAYSKAYNDNIKSAADLTPEHLGKAVTLITDLRNKLVK